MQILVSHTSRDRDLALGLLDYLTNLGHKVERWSNPLATGRPVIDLVFDAMQTADVFVILWGKYSWQSKGALAEISAIKTIVDTDETKFILPIALDDINVPIDLSSYSVVRISSDLPNFELVASALNTLEASDQPREIVDTQNLESPNIEALRKAHRNGKLTLVCGAGISIGANIPPWNTLLDRLLDAMLSRLTSTKSEIEVARSELDDIKGNSSLIAGRYLKNVLKDDFQEEVRRALYKGSHQTCETIDAIVELARPKRGQAHLDSIINFNFDDLLERNFKAASIDHKPIFSEGRRSAPTELPIFHVHGYLPKSGRLNKGNQIVFSEDSYHDQFVDPFSWSNLTQLNKFTQNTCLFVGLSMTDPNLRRLLDVAIRRDEEGDKRHFAILKRSSDSSKNRMMESLREQDAASLGISILWVNEFREIPLLIRSLC